MPPACINFIKLALRGLVEGADNIHADFLSAALNMSGNRKSGDKPQYGYTRDDK